MGCTCTPCNLLFKICINYNTIQFLCIAPVMHRVRHRLTAYFLQREMKYSLAGLGVPQVDTTARYTCTLESQTSLWVCTRQQKVPRASMLRSYDIRQLLNIRTVWWYHSRTQNTQTTVSNNQRYNDPLIVVHLDIEKDKQSRSADLIGDVCVQAYMQFLVMESCVSN